MKSTDMYGDADRRLIESFIGRLSGEPNGLRQILQAIPEYKVKLSSAFSGESTRLLSVLSTRRHGKKRIYTDVQITKGTPIFLSYLSKRDVIRMYRRSAAAVNDTLGIVHQGRIQELTDAFANRWCLTVCKPAAHFKSISRLITNLMFYETKPSRSNHPEAGYCTAQALKHDELPLAGYTAGPKIERFLKSDPLSLGEILCNVLRNRKAC